MERIVIHSDLNNFYASVEKKLRPELAGLPVAVGGNKEERKGIVLAKSEEAKRFGVKTGEALWQAKRKCPGLVVVPPRFEEYMKYSRLARGIYAEYTDLIEPYGIDECWLDVTRSTRIFPEFCGEMYVGEGDNRHFSPEYLAFIGDTLRERVKAELAVTVSVGVSFNKVFAKLGSDMKKPDATTVISRADFRKKIWPLPASDMLMVGKKTAAALKRLNILTIGDLAAADSAMLKAHFGINGEKLKNNALGLDSEPVREYTRKREAESIGHGMTATRDLSNYDETDIMIAYLAEKIARRMRKAGVRGYGVHVDLRGSDLKHVSKQKLCPVPLSSGHDVQAAACSLVREIWKCDYTLRTVSVSVFDLVKETSGSQISLFDEETRRKNENLERAIDKIRDKYGASAITRPGLCGTDFIYDKNDDEDFLPFKR